MPSQTRERYLEDKKESNIVIWNFSTQYKYIPKGKALRVQALSPATVKWSSDNWETYHEVHTLDSALGIHFANLSTENLDHEQEIQFTFFWHDSEKWENQSYTLTVEKDRSVQQHPPMENATRPVVERDKIKVFLPS